MNAGLSLIFTSLGISRHWGTTSLLSDFTDMNGDRYPDVVSPFAIQFSKPQGGLSPLVLGHSIDGSFF